MYMPTVGARVKLRLFERHYAYGIHAWAWLKVLQVNKGLTQVRVLDGDQDTDDVLVVATADIAAPLGWRERKPGEFLFAIPPEKVAEVREWFASRGGAVRWVNKEIGNSRGELLTPAMTDGQPTRPPHWAYVGESFPVNVEDIGVRTVTHVPMPPEWFPVCDRCGGKGKITVASLAKIRKEKTTETLASLKSDNRDKLLDDKHIQCWCCDGTGHKDRHIRVAVRKHYWGRDISEGGKKKARATAAKLGKGVQWDYRETGYGLAELFFFTETITPFTLED